MIVSKSLYKLDKYKIGPYRAVSLDAKDKMLAGRLGWICQTGSTRAQAYIPTSLEKEKIYPFDIKDLKRWIKRIDLPVRGSMQEYYANNPVSRHHKFENEVEDE